MRSNTRDSDPGVLHVFSFLLFFSFPLVHFRTIFFAVEKTVSPVRMRPTISLLLMYDYFRPRSSV
jgi:hypothetical protein